MDRSLGRHLATVAAIASMLGLVFAAYSTYDYAQHLDRQIHAIHCSFIPGATGTGDADNPCKAALFSAYSALFRETFWGGIPISLFAVGAFSFYAGFAVYLAVAGRNAVSRAWAFFGATSVGPLLASIVMFVISLTRVHAFCKVCVGIYVSSFILAFCGVTCLVVSLRASRARLPVDPRAPTEIATPKGSGLLFAAWLAALGICATLPALAYAAALPDYKPYLDKCGKLEKKTESHGALLKMPTARPARPVTFFEDPLCPTCKAFHQRLLDEEVFERLDVTLVLFPLDSDCNWMVDRSLHPGACVLSRAVLCQEKRAREVLEWAYDEQEELRDLGKTNPAGLKKRIAERWGAETAACAEDKNPAAAASRRLNHHLHYASDNHVPVSTPQMFLGDLRVCDEDTDLGLKYTLSQLAPEVLR